MTRQGRRWLVLGAVTLMLALAAAGCVMVVLTWSTSVTGDVSSRSTVLTDLLAGLAMASVGALIAQRRPDNAIGWLFLGIGLYNVFGVFVERYTIYAVFTSPGTLPGGRLIASLTQAAWMPRVVVFSFLLLLFPSGRLTSPLWRLVAGTMVLSTTAAMLLITLLPKRLEPPFDAYENPLGVEFLRDALPVALLCIGITFVMTLLAAFSMLDRFRRSHGDERRQFKWFALAGALLPLVLTLHSLADTFAPQLIDAVETLASFTATLLPVAVGVAILRYRLYDIDRIINRTLVYGLLTIALGGTYFALVLGLQEGLSAFNGGSDLAVVLTTLVVAALFLPARKRLQDAVDRRFNRRVYDAARTVDAFSTRLRQQIDLDTLRYELLAVVDETMAPDRATVWLRGVH